MLRKILWSAAITVWVIVASFCVMAASAFLTQAHAGVPNAIAISGGQAMWRGTADAAAIDYTRPILPDFGWDIGEVYITPGQYEHQQGRVNFISRGMLLASWNRFTIGAGPSYMTAPWPFNGQTYNFSLLGEVRFTPNLSIEYNHFSDAGMTRRNLGRDLLMFSWRF